MGCLSMGARLCGVAMLLATLGGPAGAVDPFAPAVVVNDRLITNFDIDQRLKFMQLMGAARGEDGRSKAVESLIDDQLRAEAAKQVGAQLSPEQRDAALAEFAGQRKMSVDDMFKRLSAVGVTRQAVLDLIENQALFREAVRMRYIAQATPTETEIAAEAERIGTETQTTVHVAEIVLPLAERGAAATAKLADELYASLSAGGDFAAAARKYSRSASAPKGGEVGWLSLNRLPAEIGSELGVLATGGVTRPLAVPKALVLLKVLETREEATVAPEADATVTYARLVVPVKSNPTDADFAAAAVEAEQVGRDIKSCEDMKKRMKSFARSSGTFGPMTLSAIAESERVALANLQPGQISAPVRGQTGVAVLMVCSRTEPAAATPGDKPGLDLARGRLLNARMVSYASGLLQEMRRDAVIEYR